MVDALQTLLDIDFSSFYVSNDLIYISVLLLTVIIVFEIFNLVRLVISFFFRR